MWLALMPAITRALKLYTPLKNYVLSVEKCQNMLKIFFENPSSELRLLFMHSQAATFHQAVSNVEGQYISAIESMKVIDELLDNLTIKVKELFLPLSMRNFMMKLKESGCDIDEDYFKATAVKFYKTNREYLQQWTLFFGSLKSCVKCLACNEQSIRTEDFSNLTLPHPSNCNSCFLEVSFVLHCVECLFIMYVFKIVLLVIYGIMPLMADILLSEFTRLKNNSI